MGILIGFLIAVAIGMTGVGGGVITAPVLILYMGLPVPAAVGTALAFVVLVKSIAAPMYVRRRQVNWRILTYMSAGGAPGALAGSLLLQNAVAKNLSHLVLVVVGLVVVSSSILALVRLLRHADPIPPSERAGLLGVIGTAIGMEVGFSSAGAGALGTLALFRFSRLAPTEVVGTDLMFGFVVSLAAGAAHLAGGAVDKTLLLELATGGVFGALAGVRLAAVLPGRFLRAAILLVLTSLGIQLCLKGFPAMACIK